MPNQTDLCQTCGGGVFPGRQMTNCPDRFHGNQTSFRDRMHSPKSYFETRFDQFRQTRAGGMVDTKLMARLETVSEELNATLCIDGGPSNKNLENELKKGWDTFLGTLEDIHDQL